jgi:hypothetical protein
MSASVRVGLIAGVIGLVLTACVGALFGLCGPVVSLLAGAAAGYFAAKQSTPATQSEGGKIGATAGAIAGALCVVGQLIGGISALTILPPLMESMGNYQYSAVSGESLYWISGALTALCFGIVGAGLAAGAGFGTGYISTTPTPPPPSQPAM